MKKSLSVAAAAMMIASFSAYAGEKAECPSKKGKSECSAQKSCSGEKSADCSAKKAECTKAK